MFIDYIFLLLFYVFFCVSSMIKCLEILYFNQLNSYTYQSIFVFFERDFKSKFWLWILIFVPQLLMFIFDIYNIYVVIIFLLSTFILLYVIGDKFRCLTKINYTKRVIRFLIVFGVLLFVLFVLMFLYFSICFFGYMFCLVIPLVYLLFFLSWLLLCPIEKLIACYYIQKCKHKLFNVPNMIKVGITGSYGKTSTKEILYSILSVQFNVLSTPKSYNTPLGVAKTVNNNLKSTHEIFISEMGAKKKNEINYLCKMINVDYGIVTSVGRQHTNTFHGIEGVYKGKKELPDYLINKTCVFNLMNRYVASMYDDFVGNKVGVFLCVKKNTLCSRLLVKKSILQKRHYGLKSYLLYEYPRKGNYFAKNIILSEDGTSFDLFYDGQKLIPVEINLIGLHNIINLLLAIAMAFSLGESINNVKLGIAKIKPIDARLQKFVVDSGAIVINNGYNSNIDSARFAFSVLNLFKGKKRVIITPGLIETEDDFLYNRKFGYLMSKFCDEVVIVKYKNKDAILAGLGDGDFNSDNIHFAETFQQARAYIDNANGGYVFLIENDLPDNFK